MLIFIANCFKALLKTKCNFDNNNDMLLLNTNPDFTCTHTHSDTRVDPTNPHHIVATSLSHKHNEPPFISERFRAQRNEPSHWRGACNSDLFTKFMLHLSSQLESSNISLGSQHVEGVLKDPL